MMNFRSAMSFFGIALTMMACNADRSSTLKEAWDQPNSPNLFASHYVFHLDGLPRSGETAGPRWSGDYWPSNKGGIAYRWNKSGNHEDLAGYAILDRTQLAGVDTSTLSPSEKYDIFAGNYDFSLTRYERDRTRILATFPGSAVYQPGFTIPGWEGLCHGWAPASIQYREPNPVTLQNREGIEVHFGSADIKALLTYAMHEGVGSQEVFLGRRCEANFGELKHQLQAGKISQSEFDQAIQSLPCRDTNAGAFHVVLANELGRKKQAFVADITVDREVWNQGIVGYSSSFGEFRTQRSPGAAAETVYEVDVSSVVTYINEIRSSWNAQGDSGIYGSATYRYRLELNSNREIVGGQWLSGEHPDFLFRQSRPYVSDRLRFLPEIYKAATGEDFFPPGSSSQPIASGHPDKESPGDSGPGSLASTGGQPNSNCQPNDPWCLGT